MMVAPVGMSPLCADELTPAASGHALSSNSSRKAAATSVEFLGTGFNAAPELRSDTSLHCRPRLPVQMVSGLRAGER